uniref:Membrane protein, palmitoylated 7b (MAGUK p55 subfamily member 7) n=1 Tax=Poecilia mexicana TaxID=48701 RepID=A0A3B3XGM5_9TELE
ELPPLPEYLNIEQSSVKIIRLVKNKEPLGATIRRDDETGAIIVARIMRGGAADRSGLIHSGDEVKEVNGIPVDDKKPEDIIRILAQSQGAITFKVVPGLKEDASLREPKVFLRALFDYDPRNDSAIPCKEAGLGFKKGSILQIMSQEDATWWQAKLDGDANPRAGLIPSKQFQERIFKETDIFSAGFAEHLWDVSVFFFFFCPGPSGVGMNELKRKLLISDPQHFGVTIPHTSRPKKNQESDGVEYHFISKHLFEADIHNNNIKAVIWNFYLNFFFLHIV